MLETTTEAVTALSNALYRNNSMIRDGHLLPHMQEELHAASESLAFTINLLKSDILFSEDALGETLRRSIFKGEGMGGVNQFDLSDGFIAIPEGQVHSYELLLKDEMIDPVFRVNPTTGQVVAWCSLHPVLAVGLHEMLLLNRNCRQTTGWTLMTKSIN